MLKPSEMMTSEEKLAMLREEDKGHQRVLDGKPKVLPVFGENNMSERKRMDLSQSNTQQIIAHIEDLAAKELPFDEEKESLVKLLGIADTSEAIQAIYGGNALDNPVVMRTNTEYIALRNSFNRAIGAGYELFRPFDVDQKFQTTDEAYKFARDMASLGAIRELIVVFTRAGEDPDEGVRRVQEMLSFFTNESKDDKHYMVQAVTRTVQEGLIPFDSEKFSLPDGVSGELAEIDIPAGLSADITPEDWRKFVHLIGRLPNAGWMGAVATRTDHGENVSKVPGEYKAPTTKTNVGTFDTMVARKLEEGGSIEAAVDHIWYDVDEVQNKMGFITDLESLNSLIDERLQAYSESQRSGLKLRVQEMFSLRS